jgi:hypothetical protein
MQTTVCKDGFKNDENTGQCFPCISITCIAFLDDCRCLDFTENHDKPLFEVAFKDVDEAIKRHVQQIEKRMADYLKQNNLTERKA